jgi:hypothetical protein
MSEMDGLIFKLKEDAGRWQPASSRLAFLLSTVNSDRSQVEK